MCRGRGLLQLTDKEENLADTLATGTDSIVQPVLLVLPEHGADSSG
jgi:hypothetical protein